MKLIDLLYATLHSRLLPADAIPPLWKAVRSVADSPFTDAVLKQRLYIALAAMSYWLYEHHSRRYGAEPATAEQRRERLLELVATPVAPEDVVAKARGQPQLWASLPVAAPAPTAQVAVAAPYSLASGASSWFLSKIAALQLSSLAAVPAPTAHAQLAAAWQALSGQPTGATTSTAATSPSASTAAMPASQAARTELTDLLRRALLDESRGTKEQSDAWQQVIDALTKHQPALSKNKKRQLVNMNPGKAHRPAKKIKPEAKQDVDVKADDQPQAPLHSTFMATRFHKPPPLAPIFSDARMAIVRQVFPEHDVQAPQTAVEYSALLERMRHRLSAGPPLRYVVHRKRNHARKPATYHYKPLDKAHTLRATYRPTAPPAAQATVGYAAALRLLGVLEGRFQRYVEGGGVRAEAAVLDKSGLVCVAVDRAGLAVDVVSSVFTVLAGLEFSTRKAFTLDKQQQGALNPALQFILQQALEPYPDLAAWPLIFHVYPNTATASRLTASQKETLLAQWTAHQPLLARFLQSQWTKGVHACATRGMLVPRSDTTQVDSDGWNRVAGAWNNSLRFTRLLLTAATPDSLPPTPHRLLSLYKCLKLTAGDQMQWAVQAGKDVDPDTAVFGALAKAGWLPWDGLAGPGQKDVAGLRGAIEQLCVQHGVAVHRWLGHAQARAQEDVKVHGPMICGVAVPTWVTVEQAQELKAAGFAGAKP